MNELIKDALIENIYMMQGIDITSIHECSELYQRKIMTCT